MFVKYLIQTNVRVLSLLADADIGTAKQFLGGKAGATAQCNNADANDGVGSRVAQPGLGKGGLAGLGGACTGKGATSSGTAVVQIEYVVVVAKQRKLSCERKFRNKVLPGQSRPRRRHSTRKKSTNNITYRWTVLKAVERARENIVRYFLVLGEGFWSFL